MTKTLYTMEKNTNVEMLFSQYFALYFFSGVLIFCLCLGLSYAATPFSVVSMHYFLTILINVL